MESLIINPKTMSKIYIVLLLGLFAFSPALAFVSESDSVEINQTGSVDSIALSEGLEAGSVNWTVNGYSEKGFKVVWSKNKYPTYPTGSGDKYHYYSDSSKRDDSLNAFNGTGDYYVRVCEYLGGKCGVYSNQIKVSLGEQKQTQTQEQVRNQYRVDSVKLTSGEKANRVIWQANGYSEKGFKVVWSKKQNPTYPTRSRDRYHYYSDPQRISDVISAFDGPGDYYVRVCEYLGGQCGVYSNQIKINLKDSDVVTSSSLVKDEQIVEIEEKTESLLENRLGEVLAELEELRDIVKEQQSEIKYLSSLVHDLSAVTEKMQSAINQFITYGVDNNTKKLGAGERAAVIHSYKEAYGRLPKDQEELTDAIKIANGRWPSRLSPEAEDRAIDKFETIYHRSPDLSNPKDEAAIMVMTYGLRQAAENRNLNSEKKAIKSFKAIFHKVPQSTEDWNALQAIAYSGASR